ISRADEEPELLLPPAAIRAFVRGPPSTAEHTGWALRGQPRKPRRRAGGSAERERALARETEVSAGVVRRDAPARGPAQEPELQEVRLVDVLDGLGLLADARGERGQTDRPPAELGHERGQDRHV